MYNRRAKDKRSNEYFLSKFLIIIFIFIILFLIGHFIKKDSDTKDENNILTSNINNQSKSFEKPINTDSKEGIYEALDQLAQNNSDYTSIYERREEYPTDLLKSLLRNEEMLEFVNEYLDIDKTKTPKDKLTVKEKISDHPLFIQWDKRWGYTDYGDTLMAVSGCGPTCLSMAVVALTGNHDATPYEVANYSVNNGYYVNGSGSSWSLISEAPNHYGLSSKELPLNKASLLQALDNDKILILVMGPGHFTSKGHFIVIYGYNENGFYVNDPNSYERSEKVWGFSEISDEIKNIWALSKQ